MSELLAELFRRLLLSLENLTTINNHIVGVCDTVDHDRTEVNLPKVHVTAPSLAIVLDPFRSRQASPQRRTKAARAYTIVRNMLERTLKR
jgi:hypothetical protein